VHSQQNESLTRLDAMLALLIAKDWKLALKVEERSELQMTLYQVYGCAISNGSFCNESGTAAWIIEGMNNEHHLIRV